MTYSARFRQTKGMSSTHTLGTRQPIQRAPLHQRQREALEEAERFIRESADEMLNSRQTGHVAVRVHYQEGVPQRVVSEKEQFHSVSK